MALIQTESVELYFTLIECKNTFLYTQTGYKSTQSYTNVEIISQTNTAQKRYRQQNWTYAEHCPLCKPNLEQGVHFRMEDHRHLQVPPRIPPILHRHLVYNTYLPR